MKKENKKSKKWPTPDGELVVDVYQTEKELVIQSAVAGVKKEELDISIEDDVLIIKGNRKNPAKSESKELLFQECYWGNFSRRIIIPDEVDSSKIEATIKEGILVIRIPRIIKEKKSSVKVKEV